MSKIEVNEIVPQSGTTLTLGGSGDTLSIASGVTSSFPSLTVSGDLTVDTDTLYVDSTNDFVGVGTTSPDAILQVGIGNRLTTNASFRPTLLVGERSNADNLSVIDFSPNLGQGEGAAIVVDSSKNFRVGISTSGTFSEKMRIDSSGHVIIPEGVTLGTAVGTYNASNTLDDYEEGTFTPSIIGTTSAGSGTYSVQDGDYTKVGNLVRVAVHLRWSAHTGTGNMEIGELPFTAAAVALNYNVPSFFTYNLSLGTNRVITGFNPSNSTRIRLQTIATGGGTTANLGMDTSGEVYTTLVYRV